MPRQKPLSPSHAAITAAQITAGLIGAVHALSEFSKKYPVQVRAAQGLFEKEDARLLAVLTKAGFINEP